MQNHSAPIVVSAPRSLAGDSSRLAAAFAVLLGLAVVWAAGFANASALHNATHDTRHAFGLPCH